MLAEHLDTYITVEEAIQRLRELIYSENDKTALAALQLYLDRRAGKARETVDLNVQGSGEAPTRDLSSLTTEELRQYRALLAKTRGPPAGEVVDVTPEKVEGD